MRIDVDIKQITVEIGDKEYPVAEKTVDVAERLRKADESAVGTVKQYESWLTQLEILLGKAAVKELFPDIRITNLDRIEAIYYGVLKAFDYNAEQLREEREADQMRKIKEYSETLAPFAAAMDKYPRVQPKGK